MVVQLVVAYNGTQTDLDNIFDIVKKLKMELIFSCVNPRNECVSGSVLLDVNRGRCGS